MPSSREITRTEQRIAEIDALQQTIDQLQQDLQLYGEALRRDLNLLHKEAAEPPPVQETRQVGEEALEAVEELASLEPGAVESTNLPEEDFTDIDSEAAPPTSSQRSPFELEEMEGGMDKIGGKPVSVLISDGSVSEEPLNGWVLDRPSGGLKILVDDEIKVGKVIGVKPNREHPDAQWINICVKAIRPERNSFLITCTFVERPPWKALALFNG